MTKIRRSTGVVRSFVLFRGLQCFRCVRAVVVLPPQKTPLRRGVEHACTVLFLSVVVIVDGNIGVARSGIRTDVPERAFFGLRFGVAVPLRGICWGPDGEVQKVQDFDMRM